jgi:hypothetical protein
VCWEELPPDSVRSGWDLDDIDSDEDAFPDDSEHERNLEASRSDNDDLNDDCDSRLVELVEDPLARFGYGICEKSLALLRCHVSEIFDFIWLICLISFVRHV